MRALVLAALVGMALVPPTAHAQAAASFASAAQPAFGEAHPGGGAYTNFTFSNGLDRDVTLALSFYAERDARVEYKSWTVTVPARGALAVPAFVRADANATAGDVRVTFLSQEVGSHDFTANATFTLRILPGTLLSQPVSPATSAARPAPTAATPSAGLTVPALQGIRVSPEDVNLSLGGEAMVTVTLGNRGSAPWTPTLRFELPAGVSATPAFPPGPVAPGSTVDVPLVLRAQGASAGDAEAGVLASPAQPALVRLHILAATQPKAQSAPQPSAERTLPAPALVAAGGAAVAGVGAALALRRRWPLLAAALYTRLAPNRVLDQPTRERIADLVHQEPGVAFGEIARRLDVGSGALTYHARVLERCGVVFSTRDGQQRRFYPVAGGRVGGAPGLDDRAVDALAAGPRGIAELARELGVSRQALHYHLKRLAKEGRVQAHGAGRALRFALPAPA